MVERLLDLQRMAAVGHPSADRLYSSLAKNRKMWMGSWSGREIWSLKGAKYSPTLGEHSRRPFPSS
jgi:hypothetical protein